MNSASFQSAALYKRVKSNMVLGLINRTVISADKSIADPLESIVCF